MKDRITISDNTVTIKAPSRLVPLGVFIIGTVSLITGILIMGQQAPQGDLLIGLGVIFMNGGIFFFLTTRFLKIVVNEEPGYMSILESSFKTINPIRIPVKYYSAVSIQHSISDGGSYDILLINEFGSAMHVATCGNTIAATNLGQRLQRLLGVDFIDMADSLKMMVVRKQLYAPSALPSIAPTAALSIVRDGNTVAITWNNRKSLFNFIFIYGILYGFFHIIHHVVIPSALPIAAYLLYPFLGLFAVLLLSIVLINLLGTTYLRISPDGLTYFTGIFGKRMGEKSMKRANIGFIRNSLHAGATSMQVVSAEGLSIITRMLSKIPRAGEGVPDITLMSDIFSLKNETIDINVSALSMTDRLCVETELVKNMR